MCPERSVTDVPGQHTFESLRVLMQMLCTSRHNEVTLAWASETSPGRTNPVPPPSRPAWEIE